MPPRLRYGLSQIGCVLAVGAVIGVVSAREVSTAPAGRAARAGVAPRETTGLQTARATPTFACNQIIAFTITREMYEAGFEQSPGIADDHWQLKARQSGYITEWSNPASDFWNEPPQSPCATGSASPDHVILTVLSWRPACCTTQAQWEAQIAGAVTTLQAKYSGLKRVDVMTIARAPGNLPCPTPAVAGEYVVMPPELDGAIAAVAARFPGFAFIGPKIEAASCAAFSNGGPHLTREGNAALAKAMAAYFVTLQ